MNPWPDLRPVLQDIPWVIVGAVATRAYMPERMTKDLDILIRREDEGKVLERLQAVGYKIISRLAVPGFLLLSPEGIELDVIMVNYPWAKDALAHPAQDPVGYPVLALPYLVLMKMESSRGRDFGDANTMLGLASEDQLNQVRAVVARYAPDAVGDLESMIYLGRLELEDGTNN